MPCCDRHTVLKLSKKNLLCPCFWEKGTRGYGLGIGSRGAEGGKLPGEAEGDGVVEAGAEGEDAVGEELCGGGAAAPRVRPPSPWLFSTHPPPLCSETPSGPSVFPRIDPSTTPRDRSRALSCSDARELPCSSISS